MPSYWDDGAGAVLDRDGATFRLGTIASRAQADRWTASGYDIHGAVDRYRAFLAAWEGSESARSADQLCRAFFRAEAELATGAGIAPDDPDLFRIRSAPKHHEWTAAWTLVG